jgi:hypothetical protein
VVNLYQSWKAQCKVAGIGQPIKANINGWRELPYARRLLQVRLKASIDWSGVEPGDLLDLAGLYKQNYLNEEAEEMSLRALRGQENAWGLEHTSTLDTVNNLGNLYAD